eukprot:scaffold4763_cov55-Phaeocystis_antarctica.AAC.2
MSAPTPPAGPKVVPRVLVVEDTQLAAECLCMVLKELGCTTDHAEDGAEALEQSVPMTAAQLGSCASSGRRPTGRLAATASGARASRLQKPAAHFTHRR